MSWSRARVIRAGTLKSERVPRDDGRRWPHLEGQVAGAAEGRVHGPRSVVERLASNGHAGAARRRVLCTVAHKAGQCILWLRREWLWQERLRESVFGEGAFEVSAQAATDHDDMGVMRARGDEHIVPDVENVLGLCRKGVGGRRGKARVRRMGEMVEPCSVRVRKGGGQGGERERERERGGVGMERKRGRQWQRQWRRQRQAEG